MSDDAYHKIDAAAPVIPSGCPIDKDFTPFAADYLQDPYPELRRLNAQAPIFYAEQLGYMVVTGMSAVVEVMKNHKVFSSENVQDPIFPLCDAARDILSADDYNPQAVMSNCQQPDHTRIRTFTREGFNGRRMEILAPLIEAHAHELIDAMLAGAQPTEFVAAFAHPLPGQAIFRFIGFPAEDHAELMRWTANRLMFSWGQPTAEEQVDIAQNMLRYWRYCRAFVADRAATPGDDFTSELLANHFEAPDRLSYREVESVIYGLSFAGHEIVSNFIALAVLNLTRDPALWMQLRDATERIPQALEELLRVDSPQTSWRRVATQDTTLAGIDVPKGTRIFVSLGAANHDPEVFEAPELLKIDRDNAARHVSFGHGIHFCLGARLARLEGQIAIAALVDRLPNLQVVPDQTLVYSPNMTFRGPREMLVRW